MEKTIAKMLRRDMLVVVGFGVFYGSPWLSWRMQF